MKILVKANNWLGDAVMSLPVFQSLKSMIPKARIEVLTKPAFADLYRGSPHVDETLPHARGGVGAWMRTVRELKARRYDAAIVLPRSFSSALLVWTARIPRRIGYGRARLLTDRPLRPGPGIHRVHHYHGLLSAFGTPPRAAPPRIEIPEEERAWAEQAMPGGPWIGINPGATYGAAKQWFPERFIELGKRLARRARLVVVGGPAEADLGERVARETGGICIAGKTRILGLAAAIARCSLFVTNDTGPMHVADAVGTPIAAVFGPTDWINTPPYGQGHRIVRHEMECSPCLKRSCPLGHHECMKRVSVEDVERACRELLR